MKLFFFSVLVVLLASFSAKTIAQEQSNVIESTEDELLLEDDQQLLPQKNGADSSKNQKIVENDEELILDDSEEYLLAPATVSKPESSISDSNETSKTNSVATDSTSEIKNVAADSVSVPTQTVNQSIPKPSQVVVKPKDVKIENMSSINFAQNLKQYRSPKLAMLFSFLLPGSGQLYAQHKLKAAVFGAAELAIIGTGTALAVKGRKEMKKAQQFADEHYDVQNFKAYYDIFKQTIPDTLQKAVFSELSVDEFLHMQKNKDDEFYKYIKRNDYPFVRGWNDVTPTFSSGFSINEPGYKPKHPDTLYLVYSIHQDTSKARFGFSQFQEQFSSKFSQADKLSGISMKVFFLLLLDRIVSAVDAGITAKAYNDEMLGKQSVWQRINIEQNQVNSGWDTYSGYTLVLRF